MGEERYFLSKGLKGLKDLIYFLEKGKRTLIIRVIFEELIQKLEIFKILLGKGFKGLENNIVT